MCLSICYLSVCLAVSSFVCFSFSHSALGRVICPVHVCVSTTSLSLSLPLSALLHPSSYSSVSLSIYFSLSVRVVLTFYRHLTYIQYESVSVWWTLWVTLCWRSSKFCYLDEDLWESNDFWHACVGNISIQWWIRMTPKCSCRKRNGFKRILLNDNDWHSIAFLWMCWIIIDTECACWRTAWVNHTDAFCKQHWQVSWAAPRFRCNMGSNELENDFWSSLGLRCEKCWSGK